MMAGTKKPDQEFTTFFLAFAGQEVIITVDLIGFITHSSEHGTVTENLPIYYQGILLDYDENYFYLGNTPSEISQLIPKERLVHIKINDSDKELIDEVFDSMPDPKTESDIN